MKSKVVKSGEGAEEGTKGIISSSSQPGVRLGFAVMWQKSCSGRGAEPGIIGKVVGQRGK